MAGFVIGSVMLGVGLAMDAFSVSIANGLHDSRMKMTRMILMAGTFAFFQFLMPLTGWFCVHTIAEHFTAFQPLIPWIALILLSAIGWNMIREGREEHSEKEIQPELSGKTLVLQGVATSIDALSAGFTISEYSAPQALGASLMIGAVTFLICLAGIAIGKRFGTRMTRYASIAGGVILIGIGLEIFLSHMLT